MTLSTVSKSSSNASFEWGARSEAWMQVLFLVILVKWLVSCSQVCKLRAMMYNSKTFGGREPHWVILWNGSPSIGVRDYYHKLPLPSWIQNLLSFHWKCDLALWQFLKRFTKLQFILGQETTEFPKPTTSTCAMTAGQRPKSPLQPLTRCREGRALTKNVAVSKIGSAREICF